MASFNAGLYYGRKKYLLLAKLRVVVPAPPAYTTPFSLNIPCCQNWRTGTEAKKICRLLKLNFVTAYLSVAI
ncbi:hypothetical protein [Microcoleus sp. FACHB-68]|uniref:hypothetical protein n=1 Tax=Microcoleus sp. FACHB-68 TaxID=2692826 RepID=UPI001683499F|nr:hypothetical protein [Microcoleus sp. FACHB-68]MBD1940470.1 hypothetical protein [Microcoleus sp. FACHB-68]